MSDNMNDLFANVKKMVDSGNIPDDIKQMMNTMQNTSNNSNNNDNNADLNTILNQISPEMLNNLSSMLNSNNGTSNNQNNNQNANNLNIDMNTIMKLQKIMSNMNNKNDPRANLLHSLKPYLRDSKKNKLDQYVNLLNISKIAEMLNNNDEQKKQ